jgi:putative PIN family toxin of toxin-antitoxin system
MRVVNDTNIFITFLIGRLSRTLLEKIKTKEIELVISEDLLEELIETVNRPKFRGIFSKEDVKDLFVLIEERAIKVRPAKKVYDCRDSKDNIVLECALAGKAHYIVTGDKDLLVLHPYREIEVITLSKFKKLTRKHS